MNIAQEIKIILFLLLKYLKIGLKNDKQLKD